MFYKSYIATLKLAHFCLHCFAPCPTPCLQCYTIISLLANSNNPFNHWCFGLKITLLLVTQYFSYPFVFHLNHQHLYCNKIQINVHVLKQATCHVDKRKCRTNSKKTYIQLLDQKTLCINNNNKHISI